MLLPKDIISDIANMVMEKLNKVGCKHVLQVQDVSVNGQTMLQLCAIFISKGGIVLEAYHGRRSVVVKCRSGGTKLHDKTEGKWTVVKLKLLASTICEISQYF